MTTKKRETMKLEPTTVTAVAPRQHNDLFKVMAFSRGTVRTEVYILNPGEWFEGFGGSRHGRVIGATASLIVRTFTGHGMSDYEYDVNDKEAWKAIAEGIALAYGEHYGSAG